jgi:hypothetical protein
MIGASTATDYITAPQSPYSCLQRSGYIALRVSRQLESSQHLKGYFSPVPNCWLLPSRPVLEFPFDHEGSERLYIAGVFRSQRQLSVYRTA